MTQTSCPHCGKGLKVTQAHQGKRVRCPACKEIFEVPLERESLQSAARGRKNQKGRKRPGRESPLLPLLLGALAIAICVILVIALTSGNGNGEDSPSRGGEKKVAEQRDNIKEETSQDSGKTLLEEKPGNETEEETEKADPADEANEKIAEDPEKEEKRALTEEEIEEARAGDPYLSAVDIKRWKIRHDAHLKKYKFRHSEKYPPYILFIEEGTESQEKQLGEVLMAFYDDFRGCYQKRFKLEESEGALVIICLKNRKNYVEYTSAVTGQKVVSAAHYAPSSLMKVIVVHGGGSKDDPFRDIITQGILTHEATHQLVDFFTIAKTGNIMPRCFQHWFQEGFAEFSGALWRSPKVSKETGKREYKFRRFHRSRMGFFRHMFQKKDYFAFKEIFSISDKEDLHAFCKEKNPKKFEPLLSLFYAQAWSFIYFCHNYKNGKYKEKFLAYMERELNGESGEGLFYEIFGKENMERMEAEWWEYVKGFWAPGKK